MISRRGLFAFSLIFASVAVILALSARERLCIKKVSFVALYALIGVVRALTAPLIDLFRLYADTTGVSAVVRAALETCMRIIACLARVIARLAVSPVEVVAFPTLSALPWSLA